MGLRPLSPVLGLLSPVAERGRPPVGQGKGIRGPAPSFAPPAVWDFGPPGQTLQSLLGLRSRSKERAAWGCGTGPGGGVRIKIKIHLK